MKYSREKKGKGSFSRNTTIGDIWTIGADIRQLAVEGVPKKIGLAIFKQFYSEKNLILIKLILFKFLKIRFIWFFLNCDFFQLWFLLNILSIILV